MRFRNRSLILGGAFLVPLFILIVWSVSATSNRCNLFQNLGYVSLAKGTLAPPRTRLEIAEGWFSRSLGANCRAPSITFGLGQSYSRLGRPSLAISALNDGEERGGLRHFLIGRVYEEMGREEDAWREYGKLPHDAAARFYKLGDRAEKEGDFQKALRYYSVSMAINPAAFKSYYGAALVYWRRLGDEEKAAEMLREGLAVDRTQSAQRELYRGLLCYYERDVDCAVAAWVSAFNYPLRIDDGPDPRSLAYEMLGRALLAGRPTPARQSGVVLG